MRIVVFSDGHRRVSNVLKIIERHKNNADLFFFLGDGNDDVDEALTMYPDIKIERVSGNCDFSSVYPASKIIEFGGKRFLITHGHPYNLEREAKSVKADICLFGHTHIPYIENIDGIRYMNPGSAANGRYGIIDAEDSGIMMYHSEV